MSETAINDYLTKQITINRNIVTFRLLSRALSIHVNTAKLALEKFHDASKSVPDMRIHATFFLSGDAPPTRCGDENAMETDAQDSALEGPSALAESVPVRQFLVVPEENLEGAKRKFTKLDDIHYYSLAPSPIRDPALLVTATDAVRKMDSTRTPQDLQKLGVAVDLTIKINQSIKARPKPTAEPTVPSTTSNGGKPGPSKIKDEHLKVKLEPKPELPKPMWPPRNIEVPKAKGVLDWSKAKPKGAGLAKSTELVKAKEPATEKEKETERKPTTLARPKPLNITITNKGKRKITALMDLDDEEEDEPLQWPSKTESEPKIEAKGPVIDRSANAKVGPPKRGVKRPLPPLDDEDEEVNRPPKNRPRLSAPEASARASNGRILSDEDDSEPDVKKKRIQRRTKSEIAMLWSDDDAEIIKTRRSSTPEDKKPPTRDTSLEPTADEGEDTKMQYQEDVSLEEEPVQKRPKKIREEWPVGRNGLRKRRIEKERMSTDDKGYMAVETYSEYESIASESEEPSLEEVRKAGRKVKAAKKGKGKEKAPKPSTEEEPAVESSEKTTKPGSASKREVLKEEERNPASASALPKTIKSVPAGKNGQKTLNSFFGKK